MLTFRSPTPQMSAATDVFARGPVRCSFQAQARHWLRGEGRCAACSVRHRRRLADDACAGPVQGPRGWLGWPPTAWRSRDRASSTRGWRRRWPTPPTAGGVFHDGVRMPVEQPRRRNQHSTLQSHVHQSET